jgi:outer membrane PBP1 activator LpoA protein
LKHSNKYPLLASLFCLSILLSACQTAPPVRQKPATVTEPISKEVSTYPLESEVKTATQLPVVDTLQLDYSGDDPALQQAASLFQSGNPGLALDLLDSIENTNLIADQLTRKRIMQASIQLFAGGAADAQRILNNPPESMQAVTLAAFYLQRAKAEMMLGNNAAAINALLQREQFLDSYRTTENQQLIWDALMVADRSQLQRIQQSAMPPQLAGWLELASIVQERGAAADPVLSINNWRINNLAHPASGEILEQITREATAVSPKRVALLLPLSSAYEAAASAIKDGFETMNSDQPASDRYQLRIYDYGRDTNATPLYYTQAINDGAEIIIGPLGRQAVDSLISSTKFDVPTLLLSPPQELLTPQQALFEFSLSQELEARQAAQRAWLDGHRRGVILFPQTPIGQRMASAFTDQFSQLGGDIVSLESFATEQTDFSAPVRQLLGVDRSELRIAEIKRLLGEKIVSEARRRQDVDFIFLPADNKNARLIKPVLDFYYALNLPTYSTSLIFSGSVDPVNDRDLDRIQFPDMPWMIASNIELESLRTFLQGGWPNRETSYNRLYGLGMDMYAILSRLERMRKNPLLHYRGLSGILSIDENGIIHRHMLWARFSKGIPELLDQQTTYQGRFSEKRFEATPAAAPVAGQ